MFDDKKKFNIDTLWKEVKEEKNLEKKMRYKNIAFVMKVFLLWKLTVRYRIKLKKKELTSSKLSRKTRKIWQNNK